MFTVEDFKLLMNALEAAQYNGIRAAAQAIAVYHKLGLAIQEENDGSSANQSSPDEPSRD